MKIDFKNLKHVYVKDMGNGNVMAYRLDMQVNAHNRVAEPIVNEHGEPAGFALKPNGEMLLGVQMQGTFFTAYENCQIMPVNFKSIPTEENRALMVRYFAAWLERMKKNCPSITEDGENAVWLIGCPTGWKDPKDIKAYRELFVEAGYVNPIIVAESNAAMAHFLKSNSEAGAAASRTGALCLDPGAYSNDGTYVRPGKVESEGSFVGASIIEKMIVSANLYAAQHYQQGKYPANPPEFVEAVRRRFERKDQEVFRNFLILQARWLKEKYFRDKIEGNLPAGRDMKYYCTLDNDPDFDGMDQLALFTNTRMMEDIISNIPIRNALGGLAFSRLPRETQEEIGDRTWKQCFEGFLRKLAEKFPDFARDAMNPDSPERPLVILTGGASRMDFLPRTVEEVFPNIRLVVDSTPVLSIARGLADFAPDKLRAMAFDQAFDEILEETHIDEDGDEVSVIYTELLNAYKKSCYDTCKRIIKYEHDDMVDAIMGWAEYKYDSSKIIATASRSFQAHFDGKILPGAKADGREASRNLVTFLNERFRGLLAGSGAGSTELFADSEMHLEFTDILLKDVMPSIRNELQKAYGQMWGEFCDGLPNHSRWNILEPSRPDLIKAIAQTLDEALSNSAKQTKNALWNLLFDYDVVKIYMKEALYTVWEELRKKKRTLLGDLLVEDSWD